MSKKPGTRAQRRKIQRETFKTVERWQHDDPGKLERQGGWPDWTPFERLHYHDQWCAEAGCDEAWCNSRYQVQVRHLTPSKPDLPAMIHLSIKTHSKAPRHDWRDFQRIKNELCGTQSEAVELYPAESRLMDEANQYHIYVLEPGFFYPIGEKERTVITPEQHLAEGRPPPEFMGPRQREFADHHNTDGCTPTGLLDWGKETLYEKQRGG